MKWMTMFWFVLLSASVAPAATVDSSVRTARDGSRTMVQSVVIDAPARTVWAALTTATGWRQWAVPVAWQVGARPRMIETSYNPDAKPGDADTIRQLFVSEVPYRSLAYRTVKAPSGFEHFETYKHVLNRVELEPLDAHRTRARFTAGPYPPTAAGKLLFGFFEEGNRKTIENMADVLGGHKASRFSGREK